tara:strand:- start:3402 stop:3917 length:516 start_codon:yes stop_codon:yes gene_type:complete
MNKNIIIIILTIGFASLSCKTVKYAKEEDSKYVKLPFEVKDYPDSETEFYSIQNAKGENVNLIRRRLVVAAKASLSQKIKTNIISIATEELQFKNSNESEEFNSKVETISNQSMAKIILVDSKILKQKDGDNFDMWVVYKIEIEDVIELTNKSNLGFSVDIDDFKRKALIN